MLGLPGTYDAISPGTITRQRSKAGTL